MQQPNLPNLEQQVETGCLYAATPDQCTLPTHPDCYFDEYQDTKNEIVWLCNEFCSCQDFVCRITCECPTCTPCVTSIKQQNALRRLADAQETSYHGI